MKKIRVSAILHEASAIKYRFDYKTLQAVFKDLDEELEQDWINISSQFTDAAKKHTNWSDSNFRQILQEHVNGGLRNLNLLNDSWVKIAEGDSLVFVVNEKPTIKEII